MDDREPIELDWHNVPADNTVERVARAFCRNDGRNPDLIVPSEQMHPAIAADGIAELKPVPVPLWHQYVEEAERFVVGYQAIIGGDL